MFNLFKKDSLSEEWNKLGAKYATDVNAMVAFGEAQGWDNYKGEEPVDKRGHLAAEVILRLKEANRAGAVDQFRAEYPPAHTPFVDYFEKQGQSIENLCFISPDRIAFIIGTPYQPRRVYTLTGKKIEALNGQIVSIGKSHKNEIFAMAQNGFIGTFKGWGGQKIAEFNINDIGKLPITELRPFNDGLSVLLVSSEGIYLINKNGNKLLHPVPDPDDAEWSQNIDMEHAAVSPDNEFIVVGDQCSEHRILNKEGDEIAEIGPQSSYPHCAVFSKNSEYVALNSCHFYNGITIGVPTAHISGMKIEAFKDDDRYTILDEDCRVYHALATGRYYIFGDAYGYIKAFTKDGKKVWRYFLGSTISGMTISDDEQTLWVATCAGIIHKLKLDAGKRDEHVIGTGKHYEEFRLFLWKNESQALFW